MKFEYDLGYIRKYMKKYRLKAVQLNEAFDKF